MKTFFASNTIRVALAAILGSWAAYFGDQLGAKEAIYATVAALLAIFLRRGQGVTIGTVLIAVALTMGCAASPANTSTQGQAAQTLAGQQGQAAETGSATTYANPLIVYFFGGKLSLKANPGGETTVDATGAENVHIEGNLTLGGVAYGEESATSEVSSGGGSAAGTSGTTMPVKPIVPVTPVVP